MTLPPEWVVFAMKLPDGGVTLVASSHLNSVQLTSDDAGGEVTWYSWAGDKIKYPPTYEISAKVPSYQMVRADTHEEALEKLFTAWDKEQEENAT